MTETAGGETGWGETAKTAQPDPPSGRPKAEAVLVEHERVRTP